MHFVAEFTLSTDILGGFEGKIRIEVYDHDRDGTHDFIGVVHTSVRELTMGEPQFPIINKDKVNQFVLVLYWNSFDTACRPLYRNSGTLMVTFKECPNPPVEQYFPGYVLKVHGEHLDRKDAMGLGSSGSSLAALRQLTHCRPLLCHQTIFEEIKAEA